MSISLYLKSEFQSGKLYLAATKQGYLVMKFTLQRNIQSISLALSSDFSQHQPYAT